MPVAIRQRVYRGKKPAWKRQERQPGATARSDSQERQLGPGRLAGPTLWRLCNLLEAFEIAHLGDVGWPRRKIVPLDGGGEFRRRTEETTRLACGKSGEPCRLQIGGGSIAVLIRLRRSAGSTAGR